MAAHWWLQRHPEDGSKYQPWSPFSYRGFQHILSSPIPPNSQTINGIHKGHQRLQFLILYPIQSVDPSEEHHWWNALNLPHLPPYYDRSKITQGSKQQENSPHSISLAKSSPVLHPQLHTEWWLDTNGHPYLIVLHIPTPPTRAWYEQMCHAAMDAAARHPWPFFFIFRFSPIQSDLGRYGPILFNSIWNRLKQAPNRSNMGQNKCF